MAIEVPQNEEKEGRMEREKESVLPSIGEKRIGGGGVHINICDRGGVV